MNKSVPVKKSASGREGLISVSKSVFNQEEESQQLIQVRPFATEPARVGVKLGRTINLGNYESARIDVSIDIPCYVEEAPSIYKSILAKAGEILSEEVTKITKSIHVEQSVEELL